MKGSSSIFSFHRVLLRVFQEQETIPFHKYEQRVVSYSLYHWVLLNESPSTSETVTCVVLSCLVVIILDSHLGISCRCFQMRALVHLKQLDVLANHLGIMPGLHEFIAQVIQVKVLSHQAHLLVNAIHSTQFRLDFHMLLPYYWFYESDLIVTFLEARHNRHKNLHTCSSSTVHV